MKISRVDGSVKMSRFTAISGPNQNLSSACAAGWVEPKLMTVWSYSSVAVLPNHQHTLQMRGDLGAQTSVKPDILKRLYAREIFNVIWFFILQLHISDIIA